MGCTITEPHFCVTTTSTTTTAAVATTTTAAAATTTTMTTTTTTTTRRNHKNATKTINRKDAGSGGNAQSSIALVMRDVTFKYGAEPIVDDLCLRLVRGRVLGIFGLSEVRGQTWAHRQSDHLRSIARAGARVGYPFVSGRCDGLQNGVWRGGGDGGVCMVLAASDSALLLIITAVMLAARCSCV